MTTITFASDIKIKKMKATKDLARSQKKLPSKVITESKFWQQIALQQQALLHAKHNT